MCLDGQPGHLFVRESLFMSPKRSANSCWSARCRSSVFWYGSALQHRSQLSARVSALQYEVCVLLPLKRKERIKRETIRACFCISTFYIMNSSVSSDPERTPRLLTCCHFPHRPFPFPFQHAVPFLPDYLARLPSAPAVLHSASLTSYLDFKLLFTEFPAFSLLDLFLIPLFLCLITRARKKRSTFLSTPALCGRSLLRKRNSSRRMKTPFVESAVD